MSAHPGIEGHHIQVSQDLLKQYEAEGDSFLDHIITGDETWCHQYKLESKQQSTFYGVMTYEFSIKEKIQDAALSR